MAKLINAEDPDERKWYLLAVKRADDLETKIKDRRAFVVDQLNRARAAFEAGRPNEALTIQATLKEKYGQFRDLADLLGPPAGSQPDPQHAGAGTGSAPSPAPEPTPPSSSTPPRPPDQVTAPDGPKLPTARAAKEKKDKKMKEGKEEINKRMRKIKKKVKKKKIVK